MYKMPDIPESFPELCDMKYSIQNILDLKSIFIEIRKLSFGCIAFMSLFLSPLPTATHLPPSAAPLSSLMQLSSMSENEDVLLEFFVSLPQLKQITNDKEELVTSIVDMASKLLFDT